MPPRRATASPGEKETQSLSIWLVPTAGGNQITDLRNVDAIDPGSWGSGAGRGYFIKGYSVRFTDIGEYPQNYSCMAVPIIPNLDLRTFYMESDGVIVDQIGNPY